MSYDITQAVKITNASPNVDWYYGGDDGVWASLAAAKTGVPSVVRMIGKTVLVNVAASGETPVYKEYWWRNGITDNDLVEKSGGGSVTSVKVGTTTYTPTSGVISLPAYLPLSSTGSTVWCTSSDTPVYFGGNSSTATYIGFKKDTGQTMGYIGVKEVSGTAHPYFYDGSSKEMALKSDIPSASSDNNTASWGSAVVVGTVGGTQLKFTMPSNPNTNTTYSLSVSGTSIKLTPSSGTANTITVPYATYAGLLAYSHTNEINFKGGAQGTVYFNYRNADTDAAATSANITYKFCNYNNDTSKTTIEAATFTGNAATATKATQDGNGNVISSTYLKSVPKASSSVYGGAKIWAGGTNNDTLYIQTT